jgi:hypothetical protein
MSGLEFRVKIDWHGHIFCILVQARKPHCGIAANKSAKVPEVKKYQKVIRNIPGIYPG